jgi:DnaJ-class molecular chaperone
MSRKITEIVLDAENIAVTGQVDGFYSKGHVCGYCHGNGWIWGRNKYREEQQEECPICGGSGELDAIVTVKWCAAPRRRCPLDAK